MLAGMALQLDAAMPPERPRGQFWPAAEALFGSACLAAGWFLRRTATRLDEPH